MKNDLPVSPGRDTLYIDGSLAGGYIGFSVWGSRPAELGRGGALYCLCDQRYERRN